MVCLSEIYYMPIWGQSGRERGCGCVYPGQSAEILGRRVTSSTSLKDAMDGVVYVQVRLYMEVYVCMYRVT